MAGLSRIVDGLGMSGICVITSALPNTDEPTWGERAVDEVEQAPPTTITTNPQLVGKTQKELTALLTAFRLNPDSYPGLTEDAVKAANTEALRKNKAAKAEAAAAPAPAKEKAKMSEKELKEYRAQTPCLNEKNGKECPDWCGFKHIKRRAAPASASAAPASASAAAPAAASEKVKAILKVASTLDLEQLTSLLRAITDLADRADRADLAALAALV